MRIGEFLLDPRAHRLGHFGRNRRRRLIVEIDHAASAFARDAMRRHSPRKRSTSASLVRGPKLTRMNPPAISAGTFIAVSTSLAFILPDEQALPDDTAIAARSSCTSKDALDAPGSAIAPIVAILGASSATITPPHSRTSFSRYARKLANRSISYGFAASAAARP